MAARPEWTTGCPDWEARIEEGRSLVPCAPLFPEEAESGLAVFKSLRIADVPGKPSIGEVGRDWAFDFVGAIFGAYDPDAERQLIREFLLVVSKKNSKSTLAAGIMMAVLIRNPRHSAEFVILAPTKEIADNSFDPAADMADMINKEQEANGKAALFRVYLREKRIVHLGTKAELKVIAADSDTVGGTKASVVLVDELWLFGKRAGAMSMFREATGGLAARPEGFVIYLSTMSDEPPAGEFKTKLNYGRDVRDGKIEDKRFLPVIYEFPKRMLDAGEHKKPARFYVTNPNIGASVDVEYLEREFAKAEASGEAALRDFLAKHLNVEIGMNLRSDRWAGADYWEGAAEAGMTLDAILERSEVVTIGIDGGGADDLLGLAVIGREKDTRRWLHWGHAWAHPKALERRKENVTTYEGFVKAGDMTIIGDYPEDLDGVVEVVSRINEAGLLACVGVDTIGLAGIVDALAEIGVTEASGQVAGIGQGYVLTGAIKGLERKLIDGTFVHCGQPLMAWCVGNARVEPTKNAFLVTKQASGYAKIDPLMATFDAAKLMERNPEPRGALTAEGIFGGIA